MTKQTSITLVVLGLLAFSAAPANAQAQYVQGQTGDFGRSTFTTNNYRFPNSANTTNQRNPRLPMAGLGGTAPIFGPTGRNGLPVTSLDSFVLNAGGMAELIYGDEGADGIPPYFEFTTEHRINTGIQGARAAGLTTGHGSMMPDAWGGDEFVKGPEWSRSGAANSGPVWAMPGFSSGNGLRNMNPSVGGVNFGANGTLGPQGQILQGYQTQASQPAVDQNQNMVQQNQNQQNQNQNQGFVPGTNTPTPNQFNTNGSGF